MRSTRELDKEWRRLKPKISEILGDKCFYCGKPAEEHHHIIPKHMGGDNRIQNIVPICYECHMKAHSKRSYKPHGDWGRPKMKPPENFGEVVNLYLDNQIRFTDCLQMTGLKRNTFYRMLDDYRQATGDDRKHKNRGHRRSEAQCQ